VGSATAWLSHGSEMAVPPKPGKLGSSAAWGQEMPEMAAQMEQKGPSMAGGDSKYPAPADGANGSNGTAAASAADDGEWQHWRNWSTPPGDYDRDRRRRLADLWQHSNNDEPRSRDWSTREANEPRASGVTWREQQHDGATWHQAYEGGGGEEWSANTWSAHTRHKTWDSKEWRGKEWSTRPHTS